ncbi:MAG: hypothetical protein ACUVUG_04930 [Candidatus Aminicenantia bacterium]
MEERVVKIKVNGKEINLKPFLQDMVKNVIMGMLQSLKIDDEEIREIYISIKI